jgi:hypothetical protein
VKAPPERASESAVAATQARLVGKRFNQFNLFVGEGLNFGFQNGDDATKIPFAELSAAV